MDFSQYLDQYMTAKRLRGVTPTVRQGTAIFSPYFDRQASVNAVGRRLDLAERAQTSRERQMAETLAANKDLSGNELAFKRENALANLALENMQQQAQMSAARKGDRNAMIGNVISSAGSLGGLALLKKYGYFDRRY